MTRSDRTATRLDATDALATLAMIDFAEQPFDTVMETIAGLAKRSIPGVDEASVTIVTGGRATSVAYTATLALDLDESQYERGYGPCLDVSVSNDSVRVDDMASEERWADYMRVAVEKGARSSLSVPLPVQQESVGALNLYATTAYAFDDASEELGAVFAGYAAVALANARAFADAAQLAEHMQAAMRSRATIEQAKGILMGERRCTPDEAFRILVDLSQRSNRKLREVAEALVERAQSPDR